MPWPQWYSTLLADNFDQQARPLHHASTTWTASKMNKARAGTTSSLSATTTTTTTITITKMTSTALTLTPSWTPTVSLPAAFEVHSPDFLNLTGHHPTLSILTTNHNTSTAFAHEAPIYISQTRTLYMTSNILTDPATNSSTIQISKITLDDPAPLTAQLLTPTPAIPNPNGGTAINETTILLCGQGDATHPAGLYTLSLANDTYTSRPLLTTFHARAYNSPNDVAIHPADGSIWFTDPDYASIQGLRGPTQPQLPNQVYRYNPATHAVRVVADGFDQPNGISFAPGGRTVYVTDTGAALGNGTVDLTRPATMYVPPPVSGFVTLRISDWGDANCLPRMQIRIRCHHDPRAAVPDESAGVCDGGRGRARWD
ncbi:calcium-dependent phosphotriesterase [Aspergillus indologenus CBS 114.80]|uniref:Calcium-dependent phosphotriesterase n=1 Tax=Aspergillus indologenus CBS 114.80 TaxID=1450541 RepID=A0A2V5HNV7_9EURO|nr:calcium-dependent phosphotriesterase [Aspergillus indologenus CBS 114.80]